MTESLELRTCTTLDEVNVVLDELAQNANKSIAHALRAQIQVIKYISTPSMYGSAFDLFFKNLKDAIRFADEETAYEIKDRAGLMLNNFVFFMKAKIEWEMAVNRKEYENLLIEASNDLAENIQALTQLATQSAIISNGGVCVNNVAQLKKSVSQLSSVFVPQKGEKDGWLQKGMRWAFKNKRIKEKQRDFCKTLDRLAEKLEDQYEIIGRNDLIAGIFQNFRYDLLEYHEVEDCADVKNKLVWLKRKSWIFPLTIICIGGGISFIVWFIRWIISWFTSPTEGWGVQQWIWTGIVLGGFAVGSLLICFVKRLILQNKIKTIKQFWKDHYDELIEKFKS